MECLNLEKVCNVNFNQLSYIVALDMHRNFARAAEHCEIAQSTLSKEVQRLEKEFDIIIFDRSRHPLVPTMKGVDLIEQAKAILKAQHVFVNIANRKKNKPVGNFRLGILSVLAPYILPLFVQKLSKKYPELDLDIIELYPSEMINHFESGNLDGAISIAPFQKEGYYETSIFEEEFVLYVGRDHFLFKQEKVNWDDIPMDELILPEELRTYFLQKKQQLPSGIAEKGMEHLIFKHASLETIRKMIDRNGGLTLIPQLACLYMGERRLEMVRHIEEASLGRTINFITSRGFQKNRLAKVILEEIIESVPRTIR